MGTVGASVRRRRHTRVTVGGLLVVVGAGLVSAGVARPAVASGPPAVVTIGNDPTNGSLDGSYVNAQDIANNLVFTNVDIQATQEIDFADPIDLSTSVYGTPGFDLSLEAPVCNVAGSVNFSHYGTLLLNCGTLNLNAKFTSDGGLLTQRFFSSAAHVNVLGTGASLQQAVDYSRASPPADVAVSPGNYSEHVTIAKPVRLHGDDGTAAAGAGPSAPTIVGTAPQVTCWR